MSDRGDFQFVCDIKEAIQRIDGYIKNISFQAFLNDFKTQDAVVRNLEIIGEAAKNISIDIKSKYPAVPWKDLAGVRDRLIHHYFGVNYDVVWVIIRDELGSVLLSIEEVIKNNRRKS